MLLFLVIILAYLLVTRDPLLSPCEGEAGYVLRLAFFPLYMPFMKKMDSSSREVSVSNFPLTGG